MLNLFRRTKFKEWELKLLSNITEKLPVEYYPLKQQVKQGLFKGVLVGLSDIPEYVGFTVNSELYKKFYEEKGRNYKLTNIKVYNQSSKNYISCNIYVSYGIINGYSLSEKKPSIDPDNIIMDDLRIVYLDTANEELLQLLTSVEKDLINPSDIYEIVLGGEVYYHLKDLEDGDFIAMNRQKQFFNITHDPFQIIPLQRPLKDILK